MKADKLKQLFGLCIEKGLNFDYMPNNSIGVSHWDGNRGMVFRERAWFNGSDLDLKKLDELTEKVKEYQP